MTGIADMSSAPTFGQRLRRTRSAVVKGISELGNPRLDGGLHLLLPVAAMAAVVLFVTFFLFLWTTVAILSGFKAPNDKTLPAVLTAAVSLTALTGASLGAVYAFRKQVLAEREGLRADQQVYSDRYVKAAELLSHERPSARLAGLHSMAVLADDWSEGRTPCVMAICSYLRLPTLDLKSDTPDLGESEVRRTAWKAVRARLLDPGSRGAWHSQELDFSGGHFDNVDLDQVKLEGVRLQFRNCVFRNGELRLRAATLQDAVLDFTGSSFHNFKIMMQGTELGGKSVVSFDEATVTESSFELDRMRIGSSSHFLLREAQVSDSALKFDADSEVFFFQQRHSVIDGEVDLSESRLSRTRLSMHAYKLTGRLVLNDVATKDTEISVPSQISGDSYVNLDVKAEGPTEIRVGPGKFTGRDLRIRPSGDTPGMLEVSFNTFHLAGGEVLINAMVPCWKSFRFDMIHEQEGKLVINGDFGTGVEVDIDRFADFETY
ncbi:hypothetical protein ABZS35_26590 [Micromonospora sp. NPDC005599]|uniref:hypothetical protein n=1 Tax=Micromonospora sp. NPDC005599 TaxID=3155715 RepID=UPI0033A9DE6B